MGKSKSSGSSELDPAVRQMMQETFNVGKDTIMETVPVLDAQGNQVYDYSSGFPIPRTKTQLKEYQKYEGDRFVDPDSATTRGEQGALQFLGGNQFKETDRLNNLYNQMTTAAGYTPQDVTSRDVTSRDVTAGLIDAPDEIARTMVAEERVADPDDITAREVLERGFDIERVTLPGTFTPTTFANTNLDPYMNPYRQNVLDVTLSDIERARDRQLSDLQARAAQAGAFGGTRQAVEESLINENALRELGRQSALLNQQGFDVASQLASQDIGILNTAAQQNIENLREAQRLNQATDLAAEQSMLDAAMEAQRLNQAKDLSLGQFNTEIAQQAALANQAANLEAQGMNQEDAFRVAQANVDNIFRQQSTNVSNTLEADLANQASSLEADLANQAASLEAAMANQDAGLLANQQNMSGLMDAATLASGATASELGRFGAMTDIGDRRTAREQQDADFDYQQFLEAEEYQRMLAQFLGGLLQGFPTPMRSKNSQRGLTLF
mgnify:FL=1|tara:strand:- start:4518 stop:6008 length:1491 start_codon:yes stop_codon:yes gene_type:complete